LTVIYGLDAFSAIAAGVSALAADGSVLVLPGTYGENVTLNKTLTLRGYTGAAADVVIDPASGDGITIQADSVTVSDLRVTGAANGISAQSVSGLTLTNVRAENNAQDGFHAFGLAGTLTVNGGSRFDDNGGDGMGLSNVGAVTLTNVSASRNDRGLSVFVASALSDADGTFSSNRNGGIRLARIQGNVTLVRTAADNNDADHNGIGTGLEANGVAPSIGGDVLVQGARFRAVEGGHQAMGVLLAGPAGTLTFEDSTGVVQSVEVTGNDDGMAIVGATTTGSLTSGTFSNNGGNGIRLFNFNGALTLTSVTISANGREGLFVGAGASVTIQNCAISSSTTAVDIFSGGTVSGTGAINGRVDNSGTLNPGGTEVAGILTINGAYVQSSTGVLNIELGGSDAGQFDQLVINGFADLGGTLNVSTIGSYMPPRHTVFRILTFNKKSGDFHTYGGLKVASGFGSDPADGSEFLDIKTKYAVAVPEPPHCC
jgi:hypothetical protein